MRKNKLYIFSLISLAIIATACGGDTSSTAAPTDPPPVEDVETSEPEMIEAPATEEMVVTEAPEETEEPASTPSTSVRIVDSDFEGSEITVSVGTTVIWRHVGSRTHTVTADDNSFDSGNLAGGGEYSLTFDEVGTFPYYCVYHGGPAGSGMSGVVIVTE